MLNLEECFAGMHDYYLMKGGFSVQAQKSHDVRTATDQRGEQSINRDAKTSGNLRALGLTELIFAKRFFTVSQKSN